MGYYYAMPLPPPRKPLPSREVAPEAPAPVQIPRDKHGLPTRRRTQEELAAVAEATTRQLPQRAGRLPRGAPPPYAPPRTGTSKLRTFLSVFFFVILFTAALLWLLSDSDNVKTRRTEVARVLSLARLNPLPADAKDVAHTPIDLSPVGKERVVFRASEKSIRQWLQFSPGTVDLKPDLSSNIIVYRIPPGEGDSKLHPTACEVQWDRRRGEVAILVGLPSKGWRRLGDDEDEKKRSLR